VENLVAHAPIAHVELTALVHHAQNITVVPNHAESLDAHAPAANVELIALALPAQNPSAIHQAKKVVVKAVNVEVDALVN